MRWCCRAQALDGLYVQVKTLLADLELAKPAGN